MPHKPETIKETRTLWEKISKYSVMVAIPLLIGGFIYDKVKEKKEPPLPITSYQNTTTETDTVIVTVTLNGYNKPSDPIPMERQWPKWKFYPEGPPGTCIKFTNDRGGKCYPLDTTERFGHRTTGEGVFFGPAGEKANIVFKKI